MSKSLEERLAEITTAAEAGQADQTERPIPAHVKVTRAAIPAPGCCRYGSTRTNTPRSSQTSSWDRGASGDSGFGEPGPEPSPQHLVLHLRCRSGEVCPARAVIIGGQGVFAGLDVLEPAFVGRQLS